MAAACYDCIIVGAGISGLYMARELQKARPKWKIALAERYKGLGGRTYSYSPPPEKVDGKDIHWEMGAGRVRKDHELVRRLLHEYGLTWVPIGNTLMFKRDGQSPLEENLFEPVLVPMFFKTLLELAPSTLANHTIEQLLKQTVGETKTRDILGRFPYKAEVAVLRADMALKVFLGSGEMASHENYGIVGEGFSELVKRMREELEKKGIVILNRHRLLNLKKAGGKATDCEFAFSGDEPGTSGKIQLRAEKAVVLALHCDAVAELPAFQSWKTLKLLKSEPLLRTYAVFDTKKPVWFSEMDRVVTPQDPRYILPMNPATGTIMISYTDSLDTRAYKRVLDSEGDKGLERRILRDVRGLFPEKKIPNPIFFRSHYWDTGATYWLPGDYDPAQESEEACHPMPHWLPGVWLCGESWSLRQAWVEGALEHTSLCLKKLKEAGLE